MCVCVFISVSVYVCVCVYICECVCLVERGLCSLPRLDRNETVRTVVVSSLSAVI
jgi:hypothetical protein